MASSTSRPASARCRCISIPSIIGRCDLWERIRDGILSLPPLEQIEVPTRIVHLPLSWDDPSTQEAIRRYMQGVRPDAPWCPSNLEFIRRINGLPSIADVYQKFFDASYLVMGLGRCVSWRSGRDAARSAAPDGDHEIQPRAHLDAGKRGGHRRCLSVHLRHGRSGRLSIHRQNHSGVEPLAKDRGFPESVVAPVLRPAPILSGQRRRTPAPSRRRAARPAQAGDRGKGVSFR